jgi:hypothetical protein
MSKYTNISILYLVCILAGLGAAWSDGVGYYDLVLTAIFATCVVAGIFVAMIIHERREERKHGRRRPE